MLKKKKKANQSTQLLLGTKQLSNWKDKTRSLNPGKRPIKQVRRELDWYY